MKTTIHDLNEALTYQLEGMYDAEKKIQKAIPVMLKLTASSEVKEILHAYMASCNDTRLKLKRIFGYLLNGPYNRKDRVIDQMVSELENIPKITSFPQLQDTLLVNGFKSAVIYQISVYTSARDIAMLLDLNVVVDLLEDILEWHHQAGESLSKISLPVYSRASVAAVA